MPYRPTFATQLDGSRCANANCTPTSHGRAVQRDWLGVKNGSASAIRNKVGLFCPGLTNGQCDRAIGALYGTAMQTLYGISWDAWVNGVFAGKASCIIIKYSVAHGTPYDANPNFSGNHDIYVNEGRFNAALGREEMLVYDPLANGRFAGCPNGPQWWPLSLIQKGVDALGVVDCSFTRDTVSNVHRVLYSGAAFRAKPTVASASLLTFPKGALITATGAHVKGTRWTVNGKDGWWWVPCTYSGKSGYISEGWIQGPTGAEQ